MKPKTILKRIQKLQAEMDKEIKLLTKDGMKVEVMHGIGDDKLKIVKILEA
jgi:hypothetical protein